MVAFVIASLTQSGVAISPLCHCEAAEGGRGNLKPFCHCEERSDEAISLRLPRLPVREASQ
jgi:hypothetical protein